VFRDASVDNVVFVLQRTTEQPNRSRSVIRYAKIPAYAAPEKAAWSEVAQEEIEGGKDCLFVLRANKAIDPKCQTLPLKEIATVNFGMQLRDRTKFRTDVVQAPDPCGLSRYHEPCWDGGGVSRYGLRFESLYAYVNQEARRGGCWDMSVHRAKEKVIVRQIGEHPICAYDDSRRVCLNSVFMVVPKSKYSAKFILALLNSRFMANFWLQHYSDYKRTFPKIKGTYLLELPIARIDFEKRRAQSGHDGLVEVADKMVRLHREKEKVERFFAEALNNHPHEWKNLGDTYWTRSDYVALVEKKTHVKASDTGTITSLRCEMEGTALHLSVHVGEDWKPVITLSIADDKLRTFVFYGIRQFLSDNARKKKWGAGKLLELVLEKIQVPVFLSHGVHDFETHFKTLQLVLAEMKKNSPLHNLTELERNIAAADDEIDDRVYKLYGLTPAEVRLVEDSLARRSASTA
jgi:hypothetical protein